MSTLECSKRVTISQAVYFTTVCLLLLSGCQRNDEANASGEWQIVEASNSYGAILDRSGNGLVPWQGREFTTGDSWVWQRLLIKNKSPEIERTKEEKGEDEASIKQLQKMGKSGEASERAKFIPQPSTKTERNTEKLPSRKMERNQEDNKKDNLSPKLVR